MLLWVIIHYFSFVRTTSTKSAVVPKKVNARSRRMQEMQSWLSAVTLLALTLVGCVDAAVYCDTFVTCPVGFVRRHAPESIACVEGQCSVSTCCESRLVAAGACAGMMCLLWSRPNAAPLLQCRLGAAACETDECCTFIGFVMRTRGCGCQAHSDCMRAADYQVHIGLISQEQRLP
jgi:hypothetical protein